MAPLMRYLEPWIPRPRAWVRAKPTPFQRCYSIVKEPECSCNAGNENCYLAMDVYGVYPIGGRVRRVGGMEIIRLLRVPTFPTVAYIAQ